MSVLVCGSMAYDTIMVFQDTFAKHILPEQIHILNVSFLVPEMRREFGGCAGNIAYSLKMLGGEPMIMATVGEDAGPYRARLEQLGICTTHVRTIPGSFTAQAFITTDMADNQITAFHPGAMMVSHENDAGSVAGIELAIIAPDGRDGMLAHAKSLSQSGVPFVFDPGQALPLFTGDDLLFFLSLARFCAVNDYEAQLVSERTGRSLPELASLVEALIVTRGAQGADIYAEGTRIEIAPVPPDAVVDPTGCGDAYRGGLLYGISRGYDWRKTGQLASVMGAMKIASRGAQNYQASREAIAQRYRAAYGEMPW